MDAAGWGTIAGTFIFVLIWVIVGIWDNRRAGLARREPELTAEELLRQARAIKQAEHHKAIQAWQSEYDRLMQPELDRLYGGCTHNEWVEVTPIGGGEEKPWYDYDGELHEMYQHKDFICAGCGAQGTIDARHIIKPRLYSEYGGYGLGRGEGLRADR